MVACGLKPGGLECRCRETVKKSRSGQPAQTSLARLGPRSLMIMIACSRALFPKRNSGV